MSASPSRWILLAEDSKLLRTLLADALAAHGVDAPVVAAQDAESLLVRAERLLSEDDASSVLLHVVDIELPGMDGLTLGRKLRQLELLHRRAPAPMVFFSSKSVTPDVRRAVLECFPARFVEKSDGSFAQVALAGAQELRRLLSFAGVDVAATQKTA